MAFVVRKLGLFAVAIALLIWGPDTVANDAAPQFLLPIDCDYGRTCFVQNYVDHGPGPQRADYTCGRLTYDGHQGTDFRLLDDVEMERGYRVVAAAAGVVRATRDGMPDISIADTGEAAVNGREAGNGVIIDHGNGWMTQYSHMRKGSVVTRPGDVVQAGQMLGLVGLSGKTGFPHLDFTVRHDGAVVDPFVGGGAAVSCGKTVSPMWAPMVARKLTYQPTGLLRSFFADAKPDPEAARHGAFRLSHVSHDPDALVLWADLFGLLRGDEEIFAILGPDGQPVLEKRQIRNESRVSWFSYAGIRRPKSGWLPGLYRGQYRLMRDNAVVAHADIRVEVTR